MQLNLTLNRTVRALRRQVTSSGRCVTHNACVESFFGTMKQELIQYRLYRMRQEARQEFLEYLEVFYNRQRRHSTLVHRSPAEFEARAAVA